MREERWRPQVVERVLDAVPSGGVVSDVGAGTGRSRWRSRRGGPTPRSRGRRRSRGARTRRGQPGAERVSWSRGLADELPLPDAGAHAAVISLVLHHLGPETQVRALTELHRVLRPGGRLVVADWGRPDGLFPPAAFFFLRCLDGFANTRAHARGELPELLAGAGFASVRRRARLRTAWGPPEVLEAGRYREMLADRGLAGTEVLEVPETGLEDGRLPGADLAPVRGWLDGLAADAAAREDLVRRTLTGALDSLAPRVSAVAGAVREQQAAAQELAADVERAYGRGRQEVDEAVRGGSLLRGEVLARWHDVVGTGDVLRSLETGIGRLRDRARAFFTATPAPDTQVRAAVESSVDALVHAAADKAAEEAAGSWRARPPGRALLEDAGRLDSASPALLAATISSPAPSGTRLRTRQSVVPRSRAAWSRSHGTASA